MEDWDLDFWYYDVGVYDSTGRFLSPSSFCSNFTIRRTFWICFCSVLDFCDLKDLKSYFQSIRITSLNQKVVWI